MCPDIETFAPLVHATFGAADVAVRRRRPTGPAQLQVRLADRALRQTNPVLAAARRAARARADPRHGVRSSSTSPASSRCAAASASTTTTSRASRSGSTRAGVRWGLDAAHRAPCPARPAGDEHVAGRPRPAPARRQHDRGRAAARRRRAPARRRRQRRHRPRRAPRRARRPRPRRPSTRSRGPQPLAAWVARDRRRRRRPHGDARRATPGSAPSSTALLDEVVAEAARRPAAPRRCRSPRCATLLGDRLRGRPSRANFRTGHLTVCTLVPMRSVPHRVVCLLGLDDGSFPRHGGPDGDDILERAPAPGDRDVRSEDRQLLLDALLAAGDHLVVTYSGRDERTNAARPPSVPIGELLDVIDATAVTRDRAAPATRSSSSTRCSRSTTATSSPARSSPGTPWSFDAGAVDGRARAARRPRAATRRSSPAPLAPRRRVARRARRPRALRPAPDAGVPPPAPRRRLDRRRRRARRRASRSSSTPGSSGASATGCSRPASPASTRTTRSPPRRPAGLLPPLALGQRDRRRGVAARRRHRRRAPRRPRATAPPRTRRRPRRPRPARRRRRHGRRRARLDAARRARTRRSRPSTASRRGSGCSRSPSPTPGQRVRRRDDRSRRQAASASARLAPAAAGRGRRAPRRARRPLPPRHARAVAALHPDVGDARPPAAPRPAGVGDDRPGVRRRRTATPSTCCASARACRSPAARRTPRAATRTAPGGTPTATSRAARYAHRLWDGLLAVEERELAVVTDPPPFDVCGAAAHRRHGARGQRRHRQDVHDRRPRGPLRRRRAGRSSEMLLVTFGRAATSELRDRVRERLVDRRGRRSAPCSAASRRRRGDEVLALLAAGDARRAGAPPRQPAPRRSPTSTRRRSRRPTGSASRVLHGLGVAGDVERGRHVRRGRAPTSSTRSSTTCTCASSPTGEPGVHARRRPARSAARSSPNPDAVIEPAGEPDATVGRPAPAAGRRRARRGRATQARPAAPHLRRPPDPPRRPRCATRSAARRPCTRLRERFAVVMVDEFQDTDPMQWEIVAAGVRRRRHDARADRRPEAGDLRVPRRRRARLPRRRRAAPRRRRSTATGAATRTSSPPTTRCSPAPTLGDPRHPRTARCAPPTPTSSRGCAAAPHAAALRVRVVAPRRRARRARRRSSGRAEKWSTGRRRSPATSPPTSSRCCRRRRAIDARAADGADDRRARRRPRRHRRARGHPPRGRASSATRSARSACRP